MEARRVLAGLSWIGAACSTGVVISSFFVSKMDWAMIMLPLSYTGLLEMLIYYNFHLPSKLRLLLDQLILDQTMVSKLA